MNPNLQGLFSHKFRQILSMAIITCLAFGLVVQCQNLRRPPLRLMVWASAAEKEALASRLNVFLLGNRGLRVKLTVAVNPQECRSKFLLQSQKGTPPDVCLIPAHDLAWWVDGGYVRDLNSYHPETETFVPQTITAFSRGRGLYALPTGWSTLMLYYHRTLFERHGVPLPKASWDWGDLLMAAQALTVTNDDDEKIIQYGIEVGPSAPMWIPLVWQSRGEVFREDGTCSLMEPQFIQSNLKAIEFYADLVREHHVAPPPVKSMSSFREGHRFFQQKAAMTLAHRDLAAELLERGCLDWDVAPLPGNAQSASWLNTCGYAISSQTKHPAEAWKLVRFLTGETTQSALTLSGRWAPSRKTLLVSKIFLDYAGPQAVHNPALVESLAFARIPPTAVDWEAANAILTDEMASLMSNPQTPARQALERMQARLDEMNLLERQKKDEIHRRIP